MADAAPTFFATPADLRRWLERHHGTASELVVGFRKVGSGQPSVTWPEAVDEALCFGWIDGVRKGIDGDSYQIRFTPRRPGSVWSARNVARVAELAAAGRMRPAGEATFAARKEAKTAVYAFEQRDGARLEPAEEKRFRADKAAWRFFEAQPPNYRKAALWWVVSAKRPETRARRLDALLADSAAGRTVPPLTRRPGPKATLAKGAARSD